MGTLGRLMPNIGGASENRSVVDLFTAFRHELLRRSVTLGTSVFWPQYNDMRS